MPSTVSADPTVPASGPVDEGVERSGIAHWAPSALRVASHVTVWAVVVVPAVIELADGWRPVRDDSMISIGSFRVLSPHSPTVGVWSLAAAGVHHAFYDLGPLLFWLLAVPVRLDPHQGALWGATLVCALALSVGVEGAWRVKGWPACVALALVVADVGWQTQLYADLVWNPHIGLVFLVAALATAWVVASGRFGWWPWAIVFASVAAQTHFLYVIPAVALVVVAPLAALAYGRRPSGRTWLVASLVVGAVCWVVPLVQEIVGSPGNLTLVLDSGTGHPRIGFDFGLHALATATAPHPIWATQFPYSVAFANKLPEYVTGHAVGWAVVGLVAMAAVAVGAQRAQRVELSAAAVVWLTMAASLVASFAVLPADNLVVISYLMNVLWVVGSVAWVILVWALIEVAVALVHRARARTSEPAQAPALALGVLAAGLALLVAGAVVTLHSLVPAARSQATTVKVDSGLDSAITAAVERSVAKGPVIVHVVPSLFGPRYGYYDIDYWGVAFGLVADGWHPGLTEGFFGVATHLTVPPGAHWPVVTVHVDRATRSVVSVQREPPAG